MRRSSKRFKHSPKVFLFIVPILLCILLGTPQAEGALLVLSDYVSNGPDMPDVADLYATLEFTVVGTELFLTVDNRTDENISGNQYSIAEIFFNAPDTLADIPSSGSNQEAGDGMVLTALDIGGVGVWQKDTEFAYDGHIINGFGYFDMYVRDGSQQVISPGVTATFTFTINGSESYTGEDFASLFSLPDGGQEMIAGVKFVQGPGGISGFGATNVPEPGTICLLGLGVLGLIRRRKSY